MRITYCDICGQVLELKDKKYILDINEVTEQEDRTWEEQDLEYLQDQITGIRRRMKNVRLYEICTKCKEVFEYFINIRLEELKDIKRKLQQMDRGNQEPLL